MLFISEAGDALFKHFSVFQEVRRRMRSCYIDTNFLFSMLLYEDKFVQCKIQSSM